MVCYFGMEFYRYFIGVYIFNDQNVEILVLLSIKVYYVNIVMNNVYIEGVYSLLILFMILFVFMK